MAKEVINVGTNPNDGTGDTIRDAFIKVNNNFDDTFYTDAEIKIKYENNPDTNAFTDLEKTKLSGIEDNATQNSADAFLLDRSNHTGTQTASTISDFDAEVSNNPDVTANTAKNSYPTADANKVANISVTQPVDLDQIESDVANNNTKVGITPQQSADIIANNAKISADGSVTTHNDVTDAGSGAIITVAERASLANQSGVNTGDETTLSIQTKRPLKTVEGQSLEGAGNIDLDKNDVGLGNVDNTSDLNKPISTATQSALDAKQDILSEGPFVDGDKTKLDGIQAGAEQNVQSDWTETNNTSDSFIQNKPTLISVTSENVFRSNLSSGGQDTNRPNQTYEWGASTETSPSVQLDPSDDSKVVFNNSGELFNVSSFLIVTNATANNRSAFYMLIEHYDSSDVLKRRYDTNSVYIRDDAPFQDSGSAGIFVQVASEAGDYIQVKTVRLFSADPTDDNPADQNGSYVQIEKITHTLA